LSSSVGDDLVSIGRATDHPEGADLLGTVLTDPHDFPLLNDAFAIDPVVIDVQPGADVADPIVVVHVVSGVAGVAVFPRTVVRAGAGATAGVIELVVDADTGLLADVPTDLLSSVGSPTGAAGGCRFTELRVEDGASLAYVSIPVRSGAPRGSLAHQASTIGADASLSSYAVALGGSTPELRTDSALVAIRASTLRAAFHRPRRPDARLPDPPDHRAPRTTSDLLFMGAVADTSPLGLIAASIRVRRGAVKSDAMQTNHNLVLDEGAHADSVPQPRHREKRCEVQPRLPPWARRRGPALLPRVPGVEPERPEQLIVAGFFDSIADQVPLPGARDLHRTGNWPSARG